MTNREYTVFGPAGNSEMFYNAGYKKSADMPAFLKNVGLDWYEYPCGRGVNVGEATASSIGYNARKNGIKMSVHAPYFINFANPEEEKRINSKNYLESALNLAKVMGAERVVFHPGTCKKMDRGYAMGILLDYMKTLIPEIDNAGLGDITICPETMGKKNQLGNLKEILEICQLDERIIPTIDFGHLHARRRGSLNTEDDFARVLDAIEDSIGTYRARNIHIHFSQIEYGPSGEIRHLTFEDKKFGPYFENLVRQLVRRKMTAVVISESSGTMIRDALAMKKMYQNLL
ncbi:MAG: TIM barrel protein [Clostridia bacterium]|nr:TIM barrel protein [Clostridia bacterium]